MAGKFADEQVHHWLDSLDELWLALHHESPDMSGVYASEIQGGGYVRQKVSFTSPASRAIFSLDAVTWDGLPQVTVSYVGAWNAQYNGDLVAFFEMPDPVYITSGGKVSFAAGDVALSID